MKKNNYSTVIDFGLNNLRLSIFNNDSKNIFSISKEIFEKKNYEEHSKSLDFLYFPFNNSVSLIKSDSSYF